MEELAAPFVSKTQRFVTGGSDYPDLEIADRTEESSYDNEFVLEHVEARANLYYAVVANYVFPFFLLFQWSLEVYANDDYDNEGDFPDENDWNTSWIIPALTIAVYFILSPRYRKAVNSVGALLFPVFFLTIADTLILFQKPDFALAVMGCGLIIMTGTIVVHGWYMD